MEYHFCIILIASNRVASNRSASNSHGFVSTLNLNVYCLADEPLMPLWSTRHRTGSGLCDALTCQGHIEKRRRLSIIAKIIDQNKHLSSAHV
jgi:hypothetical protein